MLGDNGVVSLTDKLLKIGLLAIKSSRLPATTVKLTIELITTRTKAKRFLNRIDKNGVQGNQFRIKNRNKRLGSTTITEKAVRT